MERYEKLFEAKTKWVFEVDDSFADELKGELKKLKIKDYNPQDMYGSFTVSIDKKDAHKVSLFLKDNDIPILANYPVEVN